MSEKHLLSHRLNSLLFVAVLVVMCVSFLAMGGSERVDMNENRKLADMPTLSSDTVFNGVFADGVEAYVADHFPLRQAFLGVNFALRENLGFSLGDVKVYNDEETTAEALASEEGMDEAVNAAITPEAKTESGERPEPVLLASNQKAGVVAPPAAGDERGQGRVTVSKRVVIHKGRAMRAFTGKPENSAGWANVLNTYRRDLPAGVQLYAMMIPTASEFYWPKDAPVATMSEKAFIDAAYSRLDRGIIQVDSYSELKSHTADPIYFRTDHHWTGLGAYHAYTALCRSAGLKPMSLDSMQKKSLPKGWLGSHHTVTRDASLRKNPDKVEYWIPPVETQVFKSFHVSQRGSKIPLLAENERGYGVFLGADHTLVTIRTGLNNGRRALVVRNSFGNPLGVFMAASFELVSMVDYRYYKGSLLEIVEKQDITDVMILSGAPSANSPDHYQRILRLLHGLPQPKTRTAPLACL